MPDIPAPPWAAASIMGLYDRFAYPYNVTVSQIVREGNVFRLPPFQRGPTWTPEQQVAFCRTVWEGRPVAPLLVWNRYVETRADHVIHGQKDGGTAGVCPVRPRWTTTPLSTRGPRIPRRRKSKPSIVGVF